MTEAGVQGSWGRQIQGGKVVVGTEVRAGFPKRLIKYYIYDPGDFACAITRASACPSGHCLEHEEAMSMRFK